MSILYGVDVNHFDIAHTYLNLGEAYKKQGYYDDAIDLYDRAYVVFCKVYKSNPKNPAFEYVSNNKNQAIKFKEIENKIEASFLKHKNSKTDVTIKIITKGISARDLEDYCMWRLNVKWGCDVSLEDQECWIILNRMSIDSLNQNLNKKVVKVDYVHHTDDYSTYVAGEGSDSENVFSSSLSVIKS